LSGKLTEKTHGLRSRQAAHKLQPGNCCQS
jgi:hypothetical protein